MIKTITVWLLVSLNSAQTTQRPVTLVERFATAEECTRVSSIIRDSAGRVPITQCIQATVVAP